jgi:hypothetical protein
MNQLELFATPAPPARRVLGYGPPGVQAKWDRAWGLEVRQAFLDEAMKRPGEWIDGSDFYRAVAIPHDIGCCWGHAMGAMVRAGMLEESRRYFGSEFPGPDYKGFTHLYRWRPPISAVARA